MSLLVWSGLGVAALLVLYVLAGIRRVAEGTECTVERFGRFSRSLGAGMHWIMPLVERVRSRVALGEQTLLLDTESFVTRDRITVKVSARCFYQVVSAAKATYEVDDHKRALKETVAGALSSAVGECSFDEIMAKRDPVAERVRSVAEDAATPWGVRLARVQLVDVLPPQDLVDAATDLARSLTEQQASRNRQQQRTEEMTADAQIRKKVAELEAAAEAARVNAMVDNRERSAESDARAALMLSQALQQGNERALDYLLARQYIDALAISGGDLQNPTAHAITHKLNELIEGRGTGSSAEPSNKDARLQQSTTNNDPSLPVDGAQHDSDSSSTTS